MAEGDADSGLGLPYATNRSRQQIGRDVEKKLAKDRGARLHPMSGAGSIKDDASNDRYQYEFKNALKSHTLVGKALLDLWRRAVAEAKDARYVIYFEEANVTATIIIERGRSKKDG